MQFKFKHIQKIVGGFFLLACIIIAVLLVIVARGQRWFQQYASYASYFDHGGGINVGASVMLKGLEAGNVYSVGLDSDNRVLVGIHIFKQYANRIREGSRVALMEPIVGSSRIEIDPGPQDMPPIKHGGTIPSSDTERASLDTLIGHATNLVKDLEDPKGDLKQGIANVNAITKNLADSLKEKKGTLGMLIERRDLYNEVVSITKHLDQILAGIDESTPDIRDSIIEARKGLKEANKVMKALQKSVFLRGNVEEYLKEEAVVRTEGRIE